MTEAKMSMVGGQYGDKYPRIVIVSLDPPNDNKGTFKLAVHRTTEYVTSFHEKEDYRITRPNAHWAMTQIIAKDILVMFGYLKRPGVAVVSESYSNREIENVSEYFCHVNVAKCCMNNEGKRQAAWQVHQNCGSTHLLKELEILRPEILISQGKDANEIMAEVLGFLGFENSLPVAKIVNIKEDHVLWMPMDHPSRHTAEIRKRWSFYVNEIQNWILKCHNRQI